MQVGAHGMRNLRRALLLVALLALISSLGWAENSRKLTPAETVSRFCGFDFDGVRLDSTNPHQPEFAKLVAQEGDWPEEPVRVVAGFHLSSVRRARNTTV